MIRLLIVCSAYIAAQMMADITSLRIVTIAGLSMDAGTLVYPFTFTLRDMVHKVAGAAAARALIITAAAINVFMALLFWVVSQLPPDPSVGPQAEFGIVLAPVWRIVFASIVAEVAAELTDTEIYRLWVERVTTRYQWARVLTSNAISVPLDSLLFAWLAFGGELPAEVVWAIVLSNILLKGATTLISLPGIYLVKESASVTTELPTSTNK
ncbi:MAG: queuosine precursor transporter [Anaerolineae bacterium]|nr:queuosine precursor transporter [Thermoflexales bacterium]MDW8408034.1 queuosine precursor transporter [Anaerolineae bacterium]